MGDHVQRAVCNCGKVAIEARGAPIVTTVCHCSGCKQAGRIIEGLPAAPPILDVHEGTAFVLYRKDRVDCTRGSELLAEHRLNGMTPTRRVVATCCNSFMFLDFTKGHWITLVRDRIEDGPVDPDAQDQARQSAFFFSRLMMAWVGMGFRTPRIGYVHRKIGNA